MLGECFFRQIIRFVQVSLLSIGLNLQASDQVDKTPAKSRKRMSIVAATVPVVQLTENKWKRQYATDQEVADLYATLGRSTLPPIARSTVAKPLVASHRAVLKLPVIVDQKEQQASGAAGFQRFRQVFTDARFHVGTDSYDARLAAGYRVLNLLCRDATSDEVKNLRRLYGNLRKSFNSKNLSDASNRQAMMELVQEWLQVDLRTRANSASEAYLGCGFLAMISVAVAKENSLVYGYDWIRLFEKNNYLPKDVSS